MRSTAAKPRLTAVFIFTRAGHYPNSPSAPTAIRGIAYIFEAVPLRGRVQAYETPRDDVPTAPVGRLEQAREFEDEF